MISLVIVRSNNRFLHGPCYKEAQILQLKEIIDRVVMALLTPRQVKRSG